MPISQPVTPWAKPKSGRYRSSPSFPRRAPRTNHRSIRNRKLRRRFQKKALRDRQFCTTGSRLPADQRFSLELENSSVPHHTEASNNQISILSHEKSSNTSLSSFQEHFIFPTQPDSEAVTLVNGPRIVTARGIAGDAVSLVGNQDHETRSHLWTELPLWIGKPCTEPKSADTDEVSLVTTKDFQIPSPLLYHRKDGEVSTNSPGELVESSSLLGSPAVDIASTCTDPSFRIKTTVKPGFPSPVDRDCRGIPNFIPAALPLMGLQLRNREQEIVQGCTTTSMPNLFPVWHAAPSQGRQHVILTTTNIYEVSTITYPKLHSYILPTNSVLPGRQCTQIWTLTDPVAVTNNAAMVSSRQVLDKPESVHCQILPASQLIRDPTKLVDSASATLTVVHTSDNSILSVEQPGLADDERPLEKHLDFWVERNEVEPLLSAPNVNVTLNHGQAIIDFETSITVCPTFDCLAIVPAALDEPEHLRYWLNISKSGELQPNSELADDNSFLTKSELQWWANDLGFAVNHRPDCIFAVHESFVEHIDRGNVAVPVEAERETNETPGPTKINVHVNAAAGDEGYCSDGESASVVSCGEADLPEHEWEDFDWEYELDEDADEQIGLCCFGL